MQQTKISIFILVLCVAACAVEDAPVQRLSEANRAALAELGVADVEGIGDPFILLDGDGEGVGEVWMGESTSTSVFLGNTAHMTKRADETVVECNGAIVAFDPADSAVPADALAILAPCHDALDVASRLLGSEVVLVDQGFRNGTECILLGINRWCEGSTEIMNHDWLCTNGGDQWVLTFDGALSNSSYCTSWW
jgi:hypothetical protein